MNSKFLALSGLFIFTFGCSHGMDIAKTDIPEDDVIAAPPVRLRPDENRRMPASVPGEESSEVAKPNLDDQMSETTPAGYKGHDELNNPLVAKKKTSSFGNEETDKKVKSKPKRQKHKKDSDQQ